MSLNQSEGRMTVSEKAEFRKLDGIIEKESQTFLEVGSALIRMHEAKLYRDQWTTFESYCEDRGLTRAHAYRLIEAAKIKMSPVGDKITNERQAREIAKIPEEKRKKVVKAAEKIAKKTGKMMTAKVIAEAHEKVIEGDVVSKKEPKPPKSGAEVLSPAKIIDKFYKTHYPPLCRGIDAAADSIGSKGKYYHLANDALNAFSKAVEQMREGKA